MITVVVVIVLTWPEIGEAVGAYVDVAALVAIFSAGIAAHQHSARSRMLGEAAEPTG
ncbi:hypothetical protein [Streptomyces sp. CC224B]|uniref:hypothetical protein n=1 Tax=Streptomyces sp. CC224B TaxID=3044571 RepID=UPI0024A89BB2|nr:hypothetical protein [Streptomyces sp. CC224B]